MILSLGWKNVWRNRTRSLVVIIAVMLGILSGIMATGIMQGWIEQRTHDCIHNEVAHIQIHNPDFLFNEEIQFTIPENDQVNTILDTLQGVEAYSPRVKIFTLAKTSWAVSGFVVMGIDPEREKMVSEVHKNVIEGNFFEEQHRQPSIVLGSKAADNLKLLNYQVSRGKIDSLDKEAYPAGLISKIEGIGTKRYRKEKDFRSALQGALSKEEYKEFGDGLVGYFSFYRMNTSIELTFQDKYGEIVHPVFKVRGIYKTNNSGFDGMHAYIDRGSLNQYTGLAGNEVHEIAIVTTDNERAIPLSEKLKKILPEQDIMSWRQLSPEIAMYTDFSNVIGYIYVVIILFALAFGIINTMLMSVLERLKELGMLMAIGMNKRRVFTMIMTESVFLTLTGAVIGMTFCAIILAILGKTGINFGMWAEGFEAIGYSAIVYPVVTWQNYIVITLLVILTGIISSVWPARKALRLNPVDALRTD